MTLTPAQLIAVIDQYVTTNGKGDITGALLNQILIDMATAIQGFSISSVKQSFVPTLEFGVTQNPLLVIQSGFITTNTLGNSFQAFVDIEVTWNVLTGVTGQAASIQGLPISGAAQGPQQLATAQFTGINAPNGISAMVIGNTVQLFQGYGAAATPVLFDDFSLTGSLNLNGFIAWTD